MSAAGDNTSQSVQFVLPDGMPAGTYLLTVSANGVTSNPLFYNVTAAEQTVHTPDLVVTGGSQYTDTYDYFEYDNYSSSYEPYNFNYSNSAANNYSQYDYGYYFNPYYANAYGDTNLGQQIGYYGHTGIATTANAYANPVYNGDYAYTQSESQGSLYFTLATESQVTFDYNSGAYVVTSGGGSYAYANAYGQVYNNSTGYYYYVYDNAYASNGGGPYTFYGASSFVIDLPAGSYTLYSDSYVYGYAYTYGAALASAYNGVALANITPVSGSGGASPDFSTPGGTGALPPGSGGSSGTAAPSGPLLAGTGFLTNAAGLNPAAPSAAPLGLAFQPPARAASSPTPQNGSDALFASLGSNRDLFQSYMNPLDLDESGAASAELWQPFKG